MHKLVPLMLVVATFLLLQQALDLSGGDDHQIRQELQKAEAALKQSKVTISRLLRFHVPVESHDVQQPLFPPLVQEKNYYKILGIPRTADKKQIKKAYKELALKWHPDKHQGEGEAEKEKAEKQFQLIAEVASHTHDHRLGTGTLCISNCFY
jgi:DnaJ-domain-containing protein 1